MSENFLWDQGTSEEFTERTLLLTGLLPPSMARRETLPDTTELTEMLISRWRRLRGRAWAWRLRESSTRLIREPDDAHRLYESSAGLLVEAEDDWRAGGRGLRLEVNVPNRFDPGLLYGALLRGGAHSAFLRRKDEGEMAWSWPLRIGVVSDSRLLAGITPNRSLRPLFQEFNLERASMRANLLLFESSLSEATEMIARGQRRPSTDAVVIFGGIGETEMSVWPMLQLLSEATGAQGVFVFDPLDEDRARTATEGLIAYLSHDLPLDSAVARLSREHGVAAFSWATRGLALATSVREQGRILARRLQQMPDARIRLDRETFGPALGLPPPRPSVLDRLRDIKVFGRRRSAAATWVGAKDIGEMLEKRLRPAEEAAPTEERTKGVEPEPISFERESSGARTLAVVAEAVAAEADAEAARREDRYLQARVETPGGRVIRGKARLLPSREYVACVFIGARDADWLGLAEPLKTPEPPEGSPLILDVLFWEPQASPRPQVAKLTLQPRGDSHVVEFPFRTAEDQSIFSARIAVYHRNRNLQTGLLEGRVGSEPARLQFTPDAAPQPKFVGLADRAGVDASLIVNDDPSGDMLAYLFRDGEAAVARVSDDPRLAVDVDPSEAGALNELTEALGRAITRITTNPDDYKDLSKEGTRTLLLELALHGSSLMSRLRDHSQMGDKFDRIEYIQIVSAHVDAFFPVEYLYDGEAPEDDALVCGDKEARPAPGAILSGTCCGAYDADKTHTICPLKFWSISKVIERHAHLVKHKGIGGQFQLRSFGVSARDRLLDPLRCAVLAASTQADAADQNIVTKLCSDLNAVLRTKPVSPSGNWAEWAKDIERARPSLLVLLPHHERSGSFDVLEIGGDKRKSMQIRPEHVRSKQDPQARPIVLLIGCQTNEAKIRLEGLVPTFQDKGAVIVVSTIATILGRHAGPVAAAIVQELKKYEGNVNATFGEVMRAVRRRLLAEGIPMVLGLTSYGDADCRIVAAPEDKQ